MDTVDTVDTLGYLLKFMVFQCPLAFFREWTGWTHRKGFQVLVTTAGVQTKSNLSTVLCSVSG